jgi:hypothetical protein
LRDLLAETCRELERITGSLTPSPLSAVSGAPPLAELDSLLQEGNMRALEVCTAIEASRRAIMDDPFAAVAAAVEILDFSSARQALAAMAGATSDG